MLWHPIAAEDLRVLRELLIRECPAAHQNLPNTDMEHIEIVTMASEIYGQCYQRDLRWRAGDTKPAGLSLCFT